MTASASTSPTLVCDILAANASVAASIADIASACARDVAQPLTVRKRTASASIVPPPSPPPSTPSGASPAGSRASARASASASSSNARPRSPVRAAPRAGPPEPAPAMRPPPLQLGNAVDFTLRVLTALLILAACLLALRL